MNKMKKPLIKIYGERNTGTNYLSQLIRLNLDVDELPGVVPLYVLLLQFLLPGRERVRDIYFNLTYHKNLGWKHTLVKPAIVLSSYSLYSDNLSFVTITKNPYAWLLSLYKRPYHQYYQHKPDFETFLTSPWQTIDRDNVPLMLPSPVELWNLKNASYLQLSDIFPVLNMRYEDLVANPGQTIELMAQTFAYHWKTARFTDYHKSTKEKSKDSNFYRDYYLQERWKAKLSPQAIALINERLDDDLVRHFGYEKLS